MQLMMSVQTAALKHKCQLTYLADAARSLSMLHKYPVLKATFITTQWSSFLLVTGLDRAVPSRSLLATG